MWDWHTSRRMEVERWKEESGVLGGCRQCLCLRSFQTSLEMKDVLLLTTPPPLFISSCSIFYFFLSPGFFIYSTNLFHPTGPCLKSLLPGMVCTSYGAAFPLFSVTSQRCTDSTLEAHLSCMRIFIKKINKNKMLVQGHLHSKQASKTLQLTVLKAQVWTVSSALYLFIFQLYSAREWADIE